MSTDLEAGAGWEQALADCETRLDHAAAVVATPAGTGTPKPGADDQVAPFAAPAVTGPLPRALVERARAIVARGEALERSVEGEQARVLAELRRLPRLPRAQRRSRLDIKA